jgi:chemotaxis protein MotB
MDSPFSEDTEGHGGHDSSERWLVSYADFITLLFALFVLLYAFSLQSKDHVNTAWEAMATAVGARPHRGGLRPELGQSAHGGNSPAELSSQQLRGLMVRLQQHLRNFPDPGVTARIDRRGLVISLSAARFFASGDATIAPAQIATLTAVVTVLDGIPNAIEVEGFTDSVPIQNAVFRDNWELSSARAAGVLRFILAHTNDAPGQFAIAGYGPYNSIADNSTDAGRAINRRVEVVIKPLSGG